jgi:hypothetical protein
MTDLFDKIESLPEKVQTILNEFALKDNSYSNCAELLRLMEAEGYTFEYGLDAVPYGLVRKVKVEVYGHDIFVACPHCNNSEEQSGDEQRHHLQVFEITEWREDVEGQNELSEMRCCCCGGEFLLEWDYENVQECEEDGE